MLRTRISKDGSGKARRGQRLRAVRRGFTLLESLLAAGIVLVIVIAVTSAVTAGQQHGYEARQFISGTLAAEEMMGRLMAVPYDQLGYLNNYDERPGEMVDMHGQPFPSSFSEIGRAVEVSDAVTLAVPGVQDMKILGRHIRVRAFDREERLLADLRRFAPYPSPALEGEAQTDILNSLE